MTTDNLCFYLQNRLIQTGQTGGQWYSDTSPFSIPWLKSLSRWHGKYQPLSFWLAFCQYSKCHWPKCWCQRQWLYLPCLLGLHDSKYLLMHPKEPRQVWRLSLQLGFCQWPLGSSKCLYVCQNGSGSNLPRFLRQCGNRWKQSYLSERHPRSKK